MVTSFMRDGCCRATSAVAENLQDLKVSDKELLQLQEGLSLIAP